MKFFVFEKSLHVLPIFKVILFQFAPPMMLLVRMTQDRPVLLNNLIDPTSGKVPLCGKLHNEVAKPMEH